MKLSSLGFCVAMAGSIAARTEASPPSPNTSYVDPCIVVCPAGDLVLRVVARRESGIPVAGAWVQLDLCACPDVRLVANPHAIYSITDGCLASQAADDAGVAEFHLAAGGICPGASVRVFADGVQLATRTAVASPDRDGDLVVDASDLARLNGKVGTTDMTADFDCDGQVTEADLSIAQEHFGHSTPSPVGVDEGSGAVAMLRQNRPNPFREATEIVFQLPRPTPVNLAVYDLRGREVAVLLRDARLEAGLHRVSFFGRERSPGVYFYRLHAGSFVATRRMALLH